MKLYLAADLGGTRIKMGLMADGVLVDRTVIPAASDGPLAPRLLQLRDHWSDMLERRNASFAECRGVAVGVPTLVEPGTGRALLHYGKFPDLADLDLPEWGRRTLGLELRVENDARMALLGEWTHGAGRGYTDLVMVTLGTGIGTAVLIGGALLYGRHGQAGILCGHWVTRIDGAPCSCGGRGCVEAETAGYNLPARAEADPGFNDSPLSSKASLDHALVFEHARRGDPCALRLREHTLAHWSALMVNLVHGFDPERILVGGGVLGSADDIIPVLQQAVDNHANTPVEPVRILPAENPDTMGLLGADALFSPSPTPNF